MSSDCPNRIHCVVCTSWRAWQAAFTTLAEVLVPTQHWQGSACPNGVQIAGCILLSGVLQGQGSLQMGIARFVGGSGTRSDKDAFLNKLARTHSDQLPSVTGQLTVTAEDGQGVEHVCCLLLHELPAGGMPQRTVSTLTLQQTACRQALARGYVCRRCLHGASACQLALPAPVNVASGLQVSAGALSGWSATRWAGAKLKPWQQPAGGRAHVAWCLGWALQPSCLVVGRAHSPQHREVSWYCRQWKRNVEAWSRCPGLGRNLTRQSTCWSPTQR